MKTPDRPTGAATAGVRPAVDVAAPSPTDPEEAARWTRPQAPREIPRRTPAAAVPGLYAYALLGGRVIAPHTGGKD